MPGEACRPGRGGLGARAPGARAGGCLGRAEAPPCALTVLPPVLSFLILS